MSLESRSSSRQWAVLGGWPAWLESIVSLTKFIRKYTKILAVGSCTLRGLKKCSTRDLGTNSSVRGQVYCIYTVTILWAPLLDYQCCSTVELEIIKNHSVFSHSSLKSLKHIVFFNIWAWNHWNTLCFLNIWAWHHWTTHDLNIS